MKKFEKIVIAVVLIQFFLIIGICNFFEVDDMTLAKGSVYSFNKGWILIRENGTVTELDNLPYTAQCEANERIIIENRIPRKYRGKTLYFLSADKTLRVRIDGKEVYSFGLNDKRSFGHTPGSVMAFVDIPPQMEEGVIQIEMRSPYDNYATYIGEMSIANRDVAILTLIVNKAFSLICSVLILGIGLLLWVLGIIQRLTKLETDGMCRLGAYFIAMGIYNFIETKTLTVFYGNQTLYSFMVFIILMTAPLFFQLYYAKKFKKMEAVFKRMLCLSLLNVAVQLFLQLTNRVDFMNMAFVSHGLVLLNIIVVIVQYIRILWKTPDKGYMIEFVATLCMAVGGVMDVIHTYTAKVGDLGKYSRYGITLYAIIFLFIHVRKLIKQYIGISEENARVLKREVENMELQNKRLLEAKAEAEAANKAKSNFLANMSHEIRTPINGVLGMDAMILDECKDPKIREYALDIQSAGRNLLSIINDILDFSKIESGKMELVSVEYELASVINDSYNIIQTRAQEKGLKVNLENDPKIPSHLYGDEVRVRQIITNLLTNAVKYTKEGSVTLRINWKSIEEKKMILQIEVIDTGIGITEENQKQLFQSFQRIDEKNNRNIEGTGLGLTITKQLVDLMHGTISVESEFGKGSVFRVEIPQTIARDATLGDFSGKYRKDECVEWKQTQCFTAPDARVLVVDDVAMNLKVVVKLLAKTMVQIDTAASGKECLELVAKKKYDVILMDHMMPEMDGIETLHCIRNMQNCPNEDTPVVMLTANAIVGAKEEYKNEGFSAYLSKPVRMSDLIDMVERFIPRDMIVMAEKGKE